MLALRILVGTQTGVAQLVAQEIELRLDGSDIGVNTLLMDDIDATVFAGGGVFRSARPPTGRETFPMAPDRSTMSC